MATLDLLHRRRDIDYPTIALLCLAGYVVFALVRRTWTAFFGPLARIPGPKLNAFTSLPHLVAMWTGHEVDNVEALHKKYGPVVRVTPDLIAVIGSAAIFKQVYAFQPKLKKAWAKDLRFYERPITEIPGPISAPDGEVHHRQRKILSPAFSEKALKAYEPGLVGWAARMKDSLERYAETGQSVDMVKIFNCTTFDIMADMTFGEPLGMLDNGDYVPWVKFIFGLLKTATRIKVARYLSSWCDAGASIVKIHGAGLLPGVFHALTEHFRYMCERVDRRTQRHSAPTDADIWSLVDTDAKATATVLTAPERHSMVNELMIAGTETTATALSGTIYHLLRSPAHLATLTTHLRARYASVHDLDMASLQADRLLDAVLREGLRLFPPLPSGLPRVVPPEGAHLEPSSSSSWSESPEVFVPGGARVAVYHKPTYQWPAYFHRADEFHPERWMREDGAFAHDRLDAVEPFSVGPRNCIGKNFAWHEMRLLLATVLVHFDLTLEPECEGWHEQLVYIVWEKRPLKLRLRKRAPEC